MIGHFVFEGWGLVRSQLKIVIGQRKKKLVIYIAKMQIQHYMTAGTYKGS